jgi:outer membrane protein TolC
MGRSGVRDKPGKARKRARKALCWALAFSQGIGVCGCTRRFFRNRADREVAEVLTDKDKYPAWRIEQFHVYPDPRARFADPSNPDRPPMPPDDPAAHDLSPNPQKPGKAGVARTEGAGYLELLAQWDAANRAGLPAESASSQSSPFLIAPDAAAANQASAGPATLLKPDGLAGCPRPFLITLEQAVELGLINSREYQDRREDLYLTALPVTLERFAFAAQFFAAEQTVRQWSGRETPEGKSNSWQFNTGLGVSKLFSTGALLLFRIANQTVVEMSGQGHTTSLTDLNLSLLQPLLRGGGKAVTLEPLTQVERNLLYQIRTYARFRKEFFVSIAGGSGGSISGGVFVPTGVIAPPTFSPTANFGSSGIVPGVVPVGLLDSGGLRVTPGASGRLNLTGAIPAPVAGYLGTLLQYTQIDLDRANIANLQVFLRLFESLKEGGDVSQLQVDQVEQQLLQGRSTLLTDEQEFLDAIDRFKLQLGLPTDLPLMLDDSAIRPLLQQFRRYEAVVKDYEEAVKAVGALEAEDPQRLRPGLSRLFTTAPLVADTRFATEIGGRWESWSRMSAEELQRRYDRLAEERRTLLDRQADLVSQGKPLSEVDQRRLAEVEADLQLGTLERSLRQYERQPWKNEVDETRRRQVRLLSFHVVASIFSLVFGEPRRERLAEISRRWPAVPPLEADSVDLLRADPDEAQAAASRTAVANRLDLMNVRAQVVDAWRQLAVYANALLGTVNVEYHLDSFSPQNEAKPLAIGGSRTRHQLVLNTELPLVRKPERNNYRASLIALQRQRRALMEAEDLVLQGVRGEVRQLRVLAENYKIQQRQVELAYQTVESSLDAFQAPPAPVAAGSPAADPSARAASLTQQLLNAQSSLLRAQNQLLTVWVTYLTTRMQLYRDLELMPLDNRGVWFDELASEPTAGRPADGDGVQPPPSARSGDGAGGGERLEPVTEPLPVPHPAAPPLGPGR